MREVLDPGILNHLLLDSVRAIPCSLLKLATEDTFILVKPVEQHPVQYFQLDI